jgi:hypothetical protein
MPCHWVIVTKCFGTAWWSENVRHKIPEEWKWPLHCCHENITSPCNAADFDKNGTEQNRGSWRVTLAKGPSDSESEVDVDAVTV